MTTLKTLAGRIARLMAGEDRKDAEFRLAIAISQLGDLARYITHDPLLNPRARPHGTKKEEVHAFGQLLVQILALAFARGIDVVAAVEMAMANWEDRDWQAVVPEVSPIIKGRTAHPGSRVGIAVVDPDLTRPEDWLGKILVTTFVRPDQSVAVIDKVLAIVTDQGGVNSHPANIAREFGVVCVVATGNATTRIKNGQRIEVVATPEGSEIHILA
jgi:phosphohistidine swiveling domain-containing protein